MNKFLVSLDTNVWIDYTFHQTLSKNFDIETIKTHNRFQWARDIIAIWQDNEIEITVSYFLLSEYEDVLREISHELKLFLMGYSTREFTNAKRDHPLTFKDYETIAETVNYFSKQVHVNTHDIDFEAIKKLQKYGAELLDAIHVIQADYSKCNFFISRDTKLITSIKNNPLPDVRLGVRIIHPKEFLEIVGY